MPDFPTADHTPAPDPAATFTFGPGGPPDPPAVSAAPDEPDPDRVPGFEIVRELGRGGMGVVYLARQTALNREVALKMVLAGGHASAGARARFLAEAKAVAAIRHPGIVQVHELGSTPSGLPYFALEYCPGGSLADKLNGTPQPPAAAARTAELLAEAAEAAHLAGVIHRDIKPANVLLAADGTPKVTDFGLARHTGSESGLTADGAVIGSPSYMAPEQAMGQSDRITALTDVYALGAVLYELLTGRPPHRAGTAWDTIAQVLTHDPVPPGRLQPGVPKDLETVCLKALEKEPSKRYATARALADDLRRFLDGRPTTARPVGPLGRAARWVRRNKAVSGLLAAGVVLVVGFLAALFYQADQRYRQAEQANRQITAANAELEQQKNEAVAARAKAQARLEKAVEAVDRMMVRVAGERWAGKPELQAERRQVLEEAVAFFQGFSKDDGNDPLVRREAARANLRTAWAYMSIGETAKAGEAAGAAAGLYDGLRQEFPADPDHPAGAAEARRVKGSVSALSARFAEALTEYTAALDIASAAAAAHPDRPEPALAVVSARSALAYYYARQDPPKAAEHAAAALAVARRLSAAASAPFAHRAALADALVAAADGDMRTSRVPAAAAKYAEADTLLKGLATERPPTAHLMEVCKRAAAKVQVETGLARVRQARSAAEMFAGIDQMWAGAAEYDALLAVYPNAFPYQLERLTAAITLMRLEVQSGRAAHRQRAAAEADRLAAAITRGRPELNWVNVIALSGRTAALLDRVHRGELAGLETSAAELVAGVTPTTRDTAEYDVACAFSQASARVMRHAAVGGPAAAAAGERWAARAVEMLAKLIPTGYYRIGDRLNHLDRDTDLDPLRKRADFLGFRATARAAK